MKTDLRASTLSEMLVVMILTGIVLLSVFDGFSLFQKLQFRLQGKLEQTMERTGNINRLESVFSGSDSILGNTDRLEVYRQGEIREILTIDDSLLILFRPDTEMKSDTLFRQVLDGRIIKNAEYPTRIDSLLFVNETLSHRFGVKIKPEDQAEQAMTHTEKIYERNEDR